MEVRGKHDLAGFFVNDPGDAERDALQLFHAELLRGRDEGGFQFFGGAWGGDGEIPFLVEMSAERHGGEASVLHTEFAEDQAGGMGLQADEPRRAAQDACGGLRLAFDDDLFEQAFDQHIFDHTPHGHC